MSPGPAPPDPDPDQSPASRDADWEAWLAYQERYEDDEPIEFEDEGDYDDPSELAEIIAEARQASADQAAADARITACGETAAMAAAASDAMGRRGPGMPGSAEPLAGEYSGPGGAFATGQMLDAAPGGPVLLGQAERAGGDDDRFDGVSDDELLGIICAADRCEAAASALKHTAVAALIRRRPASGCPPQGPADMPETWDEFTRAELAPALGESAPRGRARGSGHQKGPGPPGFTFAAADRRGPPGGYGTWRLRTPGDGRDLRIALDPLSTGDCDHRYQARGHDPGVKLRHLSQVRHATCTGPCCRRSSARADFEHNVPYEAGGRTCLCNGGPKCRYDHRLKQHPRWHVDQLPGGTFRWTAPSGRQYVTEPTQYPI